MAMWLPLFVIFNMRTDVDACDRTRGLYGHRDRICTGSWLWEKNPLPHRGLEPTSVLRLAFQSGALPTKLSPPQGYENGLYTWLSISFLGGAVCVCDCVTTCSPGCYTPPVHLGVKTGFIYIYIHTKTCSPGYEDNFYLWLSLHDRFWCLQSSCGNLLKLEMMMMMTVLTKTCRAQIYRSCVTTCSPGCYTPPVHLGVKTGFIDTYQGEQVWTFLYMFKPVHLDMKTVFTKAQSPWQILVFTVFLW